MEWNAYWLSRIVVPDFHHFVENKKAVDYNSLFVQYRGRISRASPRVYLASVTCFVITLVPLAKRTK